MNILLSITILLTSIFEVNSFSRGIWRGTTLYYKKGLNNKLDFNNIVYSYNITKFSVKDKKPDYLNLRLRTHDKLGGVVLNIPKIHNDSISNSFTNEINFFQDTTRSLIIFNYTYDDLKNLDLTSIKTSALRYGGIKKYRLRIPIINISNFLNLINKFNYCKTTKINPHYPQSQEIEYSNKFNYNYFFTNENRINHVFTDNLIISLPSIIDDYKPFSFVVGCFISPINYKQLNINYNYNGIIISLELNEYKMN